ncbi:MAG: GTP 3',8-cyclase MoaA [Cyclobacteriaceae bacterium]|nr:GTP 3',8-cyclase MoaA [Cyclobacteriaceae bacterium]
MDQETQQVYDNHGRRINYVRLAVTDRCNLRCFYCMPEHGIKYLPRKELLTYEEMERLLRILTHLGVNKLRITGGEPFVRQNLMDFLERAADIPNLEYIHLTTNGVLTAPYIPRLKAMGISSINLSIDTLDRERFKQITRRDEVEKVKATFYELLEAGIPLKINAVVIDGKNTQDIVELAKLTREHRVDVRFIEEMPFNGEGAHYPELTWDHLRIKQELEQHFGQLEALPGVANSTSVNYRIPGHQGSVGIIAAFSRTFCGSCNRIRITSQGTLKTCLYDNGVLDLKGIMRSGAEDENIRQHLLRAFGSRDRDGFEAESKRSYQISESMSVIGG